MNANATPDTAVTADTKTIGANKKARTRKTAPVSATVETTTTAKPRSRTSTARTRSNAAARHAKVKQATAHRRASKVVHLTRDASFKLIDTQRAIWLSGLGALAKVTATTGTKGEQVFETMVKVSEKIESQARDAIESNADLLKARIERATKAVDQGIDTVGNAIDARVKQALARLGYPKSAKTEK